jgi:hypothetical protein
VALTDCLIPKRVQARYCLLCPAVFRQDRRFSMADALTRGSGQEFSLCVARGFFYRRPTVPPLLRRRRILSATGKQMSKRDDLIAKYADDLRTKCKVEPDMDLLKKVTIGCGPAIYNADSSTVAASQDSELETVKANFLIKKLGLADSPALMDGIRAAIDIYGKSERNKYRAVFYYLLVKHFGKEAVYG